MGIKDIMSMFGRIIKIEALRQKQIKMIVKITNRLNNWLLINSFGIIFLIILLVLHIEGMI